MIKDLGEEVLLRIFSKLDNSTLKQCQKVCRVWYTPAHVVLIKEVILWSDKIQQFVASIDSNPKPKFLNAVKSITIIDKSPIRRKNQPPPPEIEVDLNKLFLRFPNLEAISMRGYLYFFDQFKDEADCNILLQSCPKLKTFELPYVQTINKTQYCQTLYKLRSVITSIALEFVEPVSKYADAPLTFPRVKNLICGGRLSDVIPVLKQLPALEAIYCDGIPDYHLEGVLESKSKEEKDQITKSLSQIKELVFQTNKTLDSTTKSFIKKYFTGLQAFDLTYLKDKEYGEDKYVVFLNDSMLDILCTAKQTGRIIMKEFVVEDGYLERMLDQIFKRKKDTVKGVLRLRMVNLDVDLQLHGIECGFDSRMVLGAVDVEIKEHERKVTVTFTDSEDAPNMFTGKWLDYIDEVEFYSPVRRYPPDHRQSTIDACNKMLRYLPQADKAILEYGDDVIELDGGPLDNGMIASFFLQAMYRMRENKE